MRTLEKVAHLQISVGMGPAHKAAADDADAKVFGHVMVSLGMERSNVEIKVIVHGSRKHSEKSCLTWCISYLMLIASILSMVLCSQTVDFNILIFILTAPRPLTIRVTRYFYLVDADALSKKSSISS